MDNSTPWTLEFGGTGASAIVSTSPTQLSIDFSTPNESSSATLGIFNQLPSGELIQFDLNQQNNVTDVNNVFAVLDAIEIGSAPPSFDSVFTFPTVPEPSASLLFGIGLATLIRGRRKR